MKRTRWTVALVAATLRPIVAELGRMPTAPELRARGRNDLACVLAQGRHGGTFAAWAARFDAARSGGNTHRGQEIEAFAKALLDREGFLVERTTTLAPFDLLVDSLVRVDVKSAKHGIYGKRGGHRCEGFVFHLGKSDPTCDLYMLCGVTGSNEVLWVYFVPAEKARVQTITITPRGKYTQYRGAIDELRKLVARAERKAA